MRPRPKDKPSAAQTRGVVYKIACSDFDFVYYGQTDRALQTKMKEHKRAVHVCDSNSKVAQHANEFNHNVEFDQATIVDRVTDYHKRLFLEAWHSLRDQNAGKEHINIPDIYNSLV